MPSAGQSGRMVWPDGSCQCTGADALEAKPGKRLIRFRFYFFRSTTHSQCESPCSIFLVSLNVKFGFRLSAAPSPHA